MLEAARLSQTTTSQSLKRVSGLALCTKHFPAICSLQDTQEGRITTRISGRSAAPSTVAAEARRGRDNEAYEYVELDDEAEGNFNLDFLPVTGGQILRGLSNATDRFVDVAHDLVPAGTSRSVVETTVKGALLLVSIAFAGSILSFLLNAGFVVLALYVATKIFGIDIQSGRKSTKGSLNGSQYKTGGKTQRTGSQQYRGTRGNFRTGLGQAASDLTDVWFERRKPNKKPP